MAWPSQWVRRVDSSAVWMTDSASPSTDQPVIQIGNQSYRVADLSDDARRLVTAIQDVDAEIGHHRRLQTYLEITRRSLIQELTVNLPPPIL